ncbi:MAG: transglycosylase SLT domain-containing protein [Flavobacteriales bacterium]|nr:transglycosylase SLT domain-containing protein [Flavobacteriales bacterium]
MKFALTYVLLFSFALIWGQNYRIIETFHKKDTSHRLFVSTDDLVSEGWDILAQPNFWREVMNLPPDSCIINIAETREILGKESYIKWKAQTEAQKTIYKDSVRKHYKLADTVKIYVTSGKNHFYEIEKVIPSITRAIDIFQQYNTDPWYAQAILLIESPGKVAYSNVGAYGPFQLMKSVAIDHGLVVNSKVDERKDFDKSAMGASSLLRKTCIPEAKRILKSHGIAYNETELWFRLFVLHIYHAGAGNVQGLMNHLNPTEGGQELILAMWQNEWGGFKNASQNYSQVALASLLRLHDIIYSSCDAIFECTSDEAKVVEP